MLSLISWKYAFGAIGGTALAVGLVVPLGHGAALVEPATLPVTLLVLGLIGFRLRSRRRHRQ